MTVNQASKLDRYPIPRVEDLLATLAGGKSFTKLDISQAYQQLVLDEKSKDLVVVNTHRGLFRYTRLPFGIASAPSVFQRVMHGEPPPAYPRCDRLYRRYIGDRSHG